MDRKSDMNGKRDKKSIFSHIFVSSCLFLILMPSVICAQDVRNRNVLVLHSFHRGHVWNDSITGGIESILVDNPVPSANLRIHYEYMDAERTNDPGHIQNLYEFFKKKYLHSDFDVIIATDDPAFNFLFKYRQQLFPATPVVFCGVNYFDEFEMFGHEMFTGVVESIDILRTVKVALRLHPKTKNVLVIVDKSETSIATIKTFVQNFKHLKKPSMFHFITDLTIEEVQQKLSRLSNDTLVLYVNFTSDRSGKNFSIKESLHLMMKDCTVPIYSFWDCSLGHGIVGGMMASGGAQGRKAAKMALQILKGENVRDIPVVTESPNNYMFDYRQLKRFQIGQDLLPDGSEIINIPFSFYSEYKKLVWGGGSSIAGLALIIFVLLVNTFKRKRVEKSLKHFSSQLKILHKIDQAILEGNFSEKTARDVLRYLRYFYESFSASLLIFDLQKKNATVLAVDADENSKLTQGAVFPINLKNADALRKGKPIWNDDPDSPEKYSAIEDLLRADGISGYVSIPLVSNEELIGALNLSGGTRLGLHSEKINIIQDVAASLAVAVRNTQLLNEAMQHGKELERLSAKVFEAQESTCRKISYELHDEIGQSLTAVIINLSAIERMIPSSCSNKVLTLLADTKGAIDRLSTQAHDLSLNLWPPMLRDFGLIPTLRWHLGRIAETANIDAVFNATNFRERPAEEIESSLYRFVQEALNNVFKHAQASRVVVELTRSGEGVISVTVEDDGIGFDAEKYIGSDKLTDSLGLLGMRERIAFMGGKLYVWAHPGRGTRISAAMPWKKRTENG